MGDYFAVGNDVLSIYKSESGHYEFDPVFIHYGLRGSINEFDWNQEFPRCIASTCQDIDIDNPSHGGLIHIFKPSSVFFDSKEEAIRRIEEAYGKLKPHERENIDREL